MERASRRREESSDDTFARRLMIVLAVGFLIVGLWYLSDVVLLFFGSVLVAVILRSAAAPIARWTAMPDRLALLVAGLLVLGVLAASVLLVGPQLVGQLQILIRRLPEAAQRLADALEIGSLSDLLKGNGSASAVSGLVARILTWGSSLIGAVASLVLVVFGGIYLACDPHFYRDGFLKLVPPRLTPHVAATLDDCAEALPRWLGGQLAAMVIVGVASAIGLTLVGVPSALALGFIAGLLEFVPYLGPLLAAVPALLLAGTQGMETVVWTLVVLVGVQQVENNVLMPMIASRSVSVLPVVGIYAVVVMGVVFGPLGLLFGFPLAIVADVAVRRIYIRDTLDEPVDILGEPARPSEEAAPS